MTARFRCSAASRGREDELAGTASTVRAFLLVEHPGPWGRSAFRDARLPAGMGPDILRRTARTGVRPLLVRQHGRRVAEQRRPIVMAAFAERGRAWLEAGRLDSWDDVLDLDLDALAAGRSVGLPARPGPILLVCTHGRHDPCCAELGRPTAAALSASHPELVWEASHVGGDRFAGNVVVLPDGIYYGRVTPDDAGRLADRALAGRLDLTHLRGWSSQPAPVQVAEIAVRRRLDEDRFDAVRPVRSYREGSSVVVILVDATGLTWRARVQALPSGLSARLTCHAPSDGAVPQWSVELDTVANDIA